MTPTEDTVRFDPPPEHVPSRIGPYTIKRKIGSGGMGTIYEGIQEKPRRSVAIKVMRRGVVSSEALRRFEYESQLGPQPMKRLATSSRTRGSHFPLLLAEDSGAK